MITDRPGAAPRPAASRVLLAVATAFALLGMLTTWVNVQLLDTDEWTDLSRDLLADEEIQEQLSNRIVDVFTANVAVGGAIDGAGGGLEGAARDPLANGVAQALASPDVQTAWVQANETVHQQFVTSVRSDPGDLPSPDGDLTIELRPLVVSVGESLDVPSGLLDQIPQDAASFVVLDEATLGAAQTTVRLMDLMRWVPVIVALALYGLAIAAAGPGRRVWAVRGVGWSIVVTASVVLLIRRFAGSLVVPVLVETPGDEALAIRTIDISTRLLSEIGRTVLLLGVLLVVCTWLLDLARGATSGRGRG